MSGDKQEVRYEGKDVVCLVKWKVRVGQRIGQTGQQLFTYRVWDANAGPIGDPVSYKCKKVGLIVESVVKKEGDLVVPNDVIIEYKECLHNTVMKDLCADCGANINSLDDNQRRRIAELTSVAMIHSVPELRVSKERAETLGRADEQRLLKDKKLVLLVDLDQTLIHSTNHNIPADAADVHHFQLYGPHTQWYHTKFRPNTLPFLETMSKLFELHICTFGARRYAHAIAHLIDPKELYFPKDRILSRDECFDPNLKTGNMKSLFPCGDSMVCIIDDREDVWNFAPNLVAVKPYVCFRDTGDINAPDKSVGPQDIQLNDKTDALNEFTNAEEMDKKDKEDLKSNDENVDKTVDDLNNKINESKPKELVNTCEELENKPEESDNKSQETENKSQESDNKSQQLNNKSQESEKKSQESVNESQESENNIKVLDNKCEELDNKLSETTTEEKVQKVETKEDECNSEGKSDTNESLTNSPKTIPTDNEMNSNSSSNDENNDKNKMKTKTLEVIKEGKSKDTAEDTDDYLLYLEEILTRIHSEYYEEYDEKMKYKSESEEIKIPNLKEIIPNVRKRVLNGVNIVFSGVIPTNMSVEKHKLYLIAKSFGATISTDLVLEGSPKTTHLVAAKWGTVKVNKCIKAKNIWIVRPNWLYCCAERWERVDERLYLLAKEVASVEREKPSIKLMPDTSVVNKTLSAVTPEQLATKSFATYDPTTGKRIRSQTQSQNTFLDKSAETSKGKGSEQLLEKSRQIQPHHMLDFSPLSGFSVNDLQSMGKEVDDACSEGDALSTGNTDSESDSDVEIEGIIGNNDDLKDKSKRDKRPVESSSDESGNDGECPKGWNQNKRKKVTENKRIAEMEETNDSTRDWDDFECKRLNDDDESSDDQSIGSVDEEMALAVEREFLS